MSEVLERAEAFWDGHHHISEDPNFWMAHPLCRHAINRRVSGDPNIWPLEALARLSIAKHPFRRVLSLGCGTGSLERTAMKLKMCVGIEGLDSSEASLRIAREKAREEGLDGILYRRGDLNNLRVPRRAHDLIIFHQSLHHVSSLERLLSRVGLALAEDGLLALEEWTGPSREEWDGQRLAALRRMFGELPEAWRRWPVLRDPIEHDDPSEAVRSSAILPLVRRLFHVLFERPYGGHVVSIRLSQMALDRIPKDELDLAISRWLALEEQDLENNLESSYHTALVARPRTGLDGFASRTSVLFGWPRGGVASEAAAASSPTASGEGAPAPPRDTHSRKPWASFTKASGKMKRPMRLHIGCGQQAIAGWINIDNKALPGVDRVLDVRQGLPFRGVSAIYAEHFLEHLAFDDGLGFLTDCRRALAPAGVLRLSTPNLDWVYATHYRSSQSSVEETLRDCFQLNRAFYGWGHQFLYNRATLEAALKAAGFATIGFHAYGQSDVPDLSGIERHETWQDTPDLPHVLIAEASGEAGKEPLPADLLLEFREAINAR